MCRNLTKNNLSGSASAQTLLKRFRYSKRFKKQATGDEEDSGEFFHHNKAVFYFRTLNGDEKISLNLSDRYCVGLIDQFLVIDGLLQRNVH